MFFDLPTEMDVRIDGEVVKRGILYYKMMSSHKVPLSAFPLLAEDEELFIPVDEEHLPPIIRKKSV